MKPLLITLALTGFIGGLQAKTVSISNPGFEDGLNGWDLHQNDAGKSSVAPAAAHSGTRGLMVLDKDERGGSELRSSPVPVRAGNIYRLECKACILEGDGIGLYLVFCDKDGRWLNDGKALAETVLTLSPAHFDWKQFNLEDIAPAAAAAVFIRVHSYGKPMVTAYLDDFVLREFSIEERATSTPQSGILKARIDEIAAMLPAGLIAGGASIDDRVEWSQFARQADGLLPLADRLLTQETPELSDELYLLFKTKGTRLEYQKPQRDRRYRLRIFTLAECVTNRGKYLPAIEAELRAILAEKTWILPAHDPALENFEGKIVNIDLEVATRGATIATAVKWLGDRLPKELRDKAAAELYRRVFQPYLTKIREGEKGKLCWWTHTTSNWNTVCHSQVVTAALAALPDVRERAEIIAGCEKYVVRYYDGFPSDGYCTEGLGYWNYGFGHYVLLAETLLKATQGRIDLYRADIIRLAASFPERIRMTGDVYPSFADCPRYPAPYAWITQTVAARAHGKFKDQKTRLIAAAYNPLDSTLPEIGVFGFPLTKVGSGFELGAGKDTDSKRSWFSSAGVLVSRTGAGDPARLEVAIKGGHNGELHNHNDVGGFVLALQGRSPVIDPGLDIYTADDSYDRVDLKGSQGHSVPVIAGKRQKAGKEAAARVVRTEFSDEQDTIVLDLRALYDVPELKVLERTFVYSRNGLGGLSISDRVEFASPQTYENAFITFGAVAMKSARSLVIADGPAALLLAFEGEGDRPLKMTTTALKTRIPRPPLRIGVAAGEAFLSATFTYRLTPASEDWAGMTANRNPN